MAAIELYGQPLLSACFIRLLQTLFSNKSNRSTDLIFNHHINQTKALVMKKIDEEFLHFLWKNQALAGIVLTATTKNDIEVIDPGVHNHDAGPDFLNAKVKIDDTLWFGNIELHINASDWFRHGHPKDPSYDSVILHVVYFNDSEVSRASGEIIPTAVLRFPSLLWEEFSELKQSNNWVACQDKIRHTEPIHITQWTSALMIEKLIEKSEYLEHNMKDVKKHWDSLFSRLIFRSFGLTVNTTPFEILSLVTPYNLLLRNKVSIFTLEALLLGQAGFLNPIISEDKYMESLKTEFRRLKGRLEDAPVPVQAWKFMRMRPGSFPTTRIAQLATFIHKLYPPHQFIDTRPDLPELEKLFRIRASDYWNTHYLPGKESKSSIKYVGKEFIRILIINSVVPYIFFYGKTTGNQIYCNYAIKLLEALPSEKNKILKNWGKFGIHSGNAFESQALVFLYKNYCSASRCLECQFGNNLILHGHK